MSKRKVSEPAANEAPVAEATTPTTEATIPAAEVAAPDAMSEVAAKETWLPEATLLPFEPAPRVEIPPIDLPREPSVQPAIKIDDATPAVVAAVAAAKPGIRQYALLAASLALAAVLGALAGAAAIGFTSSPPPAVQSTAGDETIALKASVTQLGRELASLKASIDSVGRSATTQFKSFADRFDRAEKAQVEPAAKLAKISESLDRLERRVAAATHDVTGTVTPIEKTQAKPPAIEGWKVVDVYAGHVVLENRAGALYSIGPGSNLPGVGKVEQIKREDGRIVVVTPKGIITAAVQQHQPQLRRPQVYAPYRYY